MREGANNIILIILINSTFNAAKNKDKQVLIFIVTNNKKHLNIMKFAKLEMF